jgi:galactoside 2-L-fucosyltransferase 1/2
MAACNHSIIDYGTFGVWGAILASGETILYNITRHSSIRVSELLPNWHVMY